MIVNLNGSPVNLMPHSAPQFRFVCDEKYQSIKTIERAAEAKLPTKFGEFRIIGTVRLFRMKNLSYWRVGFLSPIFRHSSAFIRNV